MFFFFVLVNDNDVNIVANFTLLTLISKRAIRRGALSKRGGWQLSGVGQEEEEEERGWRAEMGGKTARKLGKLSGKLASIMCVFVCGPSKNYSTGENHCEGAEKKERRTQTKTDRGVSCQELNLSYQDLGDPFQTENFLRILRRLIRVEKLHLVDNSLTSLSSVRLPRYKPDDPECTTAPTYSIKVV